MIQRHYPGLDYWAIKIVLMLFLEEGNNNVVALNLDNCLLEKSLIYISLFYMRACIRGFSLIFTRYFFLLGYSMLLLIT